LRDQLNDRQRQIDYYTHFMTVEKIDIQIEIENLRDFIAVER